MSGKGLQNENNERYKFQIETSFLLQGFLSGHVSQDKTELFLHLNDLLTTGDILYTHHAIVSQAGQFSVDTNCPTHLTNFDNKLSYTCNTFGVHKRVNKKWPEAYKGLANLQRAR